MGKAAARALLSFSGNVSDVVCFSRERRECECECGCESSDELRVVEDDVACAFSISRREVPLAAATGMSRFRMTSSTSRTGKRRLRRSRCSGEMGGRRRAAEEEGEDAFAISPDCSSYTSRMASRMTRIERTTFSCMTARHDRRSERKAYKRIQSAVFWERRR